MTRTERRRNQPTPKEIRDTILEFIGRHFYGGDRVALAKDSPRLLKWVVLKPAEWLDDRGVSISAEAYRDIFLDTRAGVLMEAIRHGDVGAIRYRPAWLGQVVESFLRIRGDVLYERAKTWQATQAGALADQIAAALGRRPEGTQPDPVRQLAQAASLLRRAPAALTRRKASADPQMELLCPPPEVYQPSADSADSGRGLPNLASRLPG